MNLPKRFLQIHTLTPYSAVLLNRDESGLAKRMTFGDCDRIRISSQSLKRHWRTAEDPHSLRSLEGYTASVRSRQSVREKVILPLTGQFPDDVIETVSIAMHNAVYGPRTSSPDEQRQSVLLGQPEIDWLAENARALAETAAGDADIADIICQEWLTKYKNNTAAMRQQTSLPAGLDAALFGRMVSSDPAANITAAISVAHALTVHAIEGEVDYFTTLDDLAGPGSTAVDLIHTSELVSGLFYGYVVLDLPVLSRNLSGNAELAGQIAHNLVYLCSEVSPGAKRGSTAPYSRASLVLLESGARQPRSLMNAFRTPTKAQDAAAIDALFAHLQRIDDTYETGEDRAYMSVTDTPAPQAERLSVPRLAQWTRQRVSAIVAQLSTR